MKNPKVDIYKFLIINRIIVLALLVAFVLFSIVFGVSINRLYSKQLNTVLVLDMDGSVVPMKWLSRKENIHVEIKNHVRMFHEYFYGYDAFNVDQMLEKALWLGDNSVEQIYIKRSNDGWFNRVKMYNVKQIVEIEPDNIVIAGNDEPYTFRAIVTLTVIQGEQASKFRFETSGAIQFVSRNYPLNPHGLIILNFTELNREKI